MNALTMVATIDIRIVELKDITKTWWQLLTFSVRKIIRAY